MCSSDLTREVKMWHSLRDSGRLGLDEEERKMFYDTCHQHEAVEGSADLIKTWLCTNRPVLQRCKQRATDERRRRSALRRGVRVDDSDDDGATLGSAGDEASSGDDASATSGISDAGLGIQIEFFEGLDAQLGNNDAKQAPRLRSAPPQRCCAADARPF